METSYYNKIYVVMRQMCLYERIADTARASMGVHSKVDMVSVAARACAVFRHDYSILGSCRGSIHLISTAGLPLALIVHTVEAEGY